MHAPFIPSSLISHRSSAGALGDIDAIVKSANVDAGRTFAEIQYLLRDGANPSFKGPYGITPAILCAEADLNEILTELLTFKIRVDEPDDYGMTPLHYAGFNGSFEVTKLLLAHKAKVDARTTKHAQTPLMKACYSHLPHSKQVVQALVEGGANVELKREDKRTALMIAAEHGNLHFVKYLHSKGATLDHQDVDGNTAVHRDWLL